MVPEGAKMANLEVGPIYERIGQAIADHLGLILTVFFYTLKQVINGQK